MMRKERQKKNISVILKIDCNTQIIKVLPSEKLDTIRGQNLTTIKDNYNFTLQDNVIEKEMENSFSLKEIMDDSKTVILKNKRQKMKIKVMEDNKYVKSEQNIDPLEKLSTLRKELGFELNKVFKKDKTKIDIDDEDNLNYCRHTN